MRLCQELSAYRTLVHDHACLTHLSHVGLSGDLNVVARHFTPSADSVDLQKNKTCHESIKPDHQQTQKRQQWRNRNRNRTDGII